MEASNVGKSRSSEPPWEDVSAIPVRRLVVQLRDLEDRFNAASVQWAAMRGQLVVFDSDFGLANFDGDPHRSLWWSSDGPRLREVACWHCDFVERRQLATDSRQGQPRGASLHTRVAVLLLAPTGIPLWGGGAELLHGLGSEAWQLMLRLPESAWSLLRCDPSTRVAAYGAADRIWLCDYRDLLGAGSSNNGSPVRSIRGQDSSMWQALVHNVAWLYGPPLAARARRMIWWRVDERHVVHCSLTPEVLKSFGRDELDGFGIAIPLAWCVSELEGDPFRASALTLRILRAAIEEVTDLPGGQDGPRRRSRLKPSGKPISAPTRPATIGYAAENWFRITRNTMTRWMKAGTVRWAPSRNGTKIFDLADVMLHGKVDAAADAGDHSLGVAGVKPTNS